MTLFLQEDFFQLILNEIIKNNFQSFFLLGFMLMSILNFYFFTIYFRRNNLKEHREDIYLVVLIIFFQLFLFYK